ncbi:MAG: hypothetical protein JWR69_3671 [Pedosphaera sp.]|nr:hypothetical protein [Pedosphaera sp.]
MGNRSTPVLLEVMAGSSLYVSVILAFRDRTNRLSQSIRLLAAFAFVAWFYCAAARITPALGTKLRDGALLAIDEAMFGQTPAIFCERAATAWLTDLMSLCYLTYHLYLFVAVTHAALVPNVASQRLSAYLFTGFAIGFAGYLLVPAIGPAFAYPELFQRPLPGGAISRGIAEIVVAGSSRYDTFPSLHVLVTCILLDHDWRHVRRRFWLMAIPSLGLMVSTIYLRHHYAVDVLAALLLFLALRRTFLKAGRRAVGSPEMKVGADVLQR